MLYPLPGSSYVVFLKFVSPRNLACEWLTSRVLDWHLLPCAVTLHEVLGGLPGRLGWNTRETQQLSATPWSCISFVDRYVSPGVPDWSEGKLLCRGCVLKLMGRHVLNSLRELKAQSRSCRLSPPDLSGVTAPSAQMKHSLKIAGMGTIAERRGGTTMRSSLTYVSSCWVWRCLSDDPVPCPASVRSFSRGLMTYRLPVTFPTDHTSHSHRVFFFVKIVTMYHCHVRVCHTHRYEFTSKTRCTAATPNLSPRAI